MLLGTVGNSNGIRLEIKAGFVAGFLAGLEACVVASLLASPETCYPSSVVAIIVNSLTPSQNPHQTSIPKTILHQSMQPTHLI
jgi:hypothetical protein